MSRIFYNGSLYSGSASHNYSTDEQVVGTWVDGKTLYEKTISTGDFVLASDGNFLLYTDTNISKMISATGYLVEGDVDYGVPEPKLRIRFDETTGAFYLKAIGGTWNVSSGYVTIRYTKSTS